MGVVDASEMPRGRAIAWEDDGITGVDHQSLRRRSKKQEGSSGRKEDGDAQSEEAGRLRDTEPRGTIQGGGKAAQQARSKERDDGIQEQHEAED